MKKDNLTKEIKEKYKDLLLKNEKLKGLYQIGAYTVIVTDFRVLMKKDFPQNLYVFKYKDVEVAEYITSYKWVKILIAFFGIAFAIVFFNLSDSTFMRLVGAEYVAMIFAFAFLTAGTISAVQYVMSMSGRMRILLRYFKKPIEINARYTQDITDFIKHVESSKKK